MPEQKMTYQERVKEMTEFMRLESHRGRLGVAMQAKAIREIFREWIPNDWLSDEEFENELLEHGYIEPKTEEDGESTN